MHYNSVLFRTRRHPRSTGFSLRKTSVLVTRRARGSGLVITSNERQGRTVSRSQTALQSSLPQPVTEQLLSQDSSTCLPGALNNSSGLRQPLLLTNAHAARRLFFYGQHLIITIRLRTTRTPSSSGCSRTAACAPRSSSPPRSTCARWGRSPAAPPSATASTCGAASAYVSVRTRQVLHPTRAARARSAWFPGLSSECESLLRGGRPGCQLISM